MMKFWICENHICELQSEELYEIAYITAMIFLHIISKNLICLHHCGLGSNPVSMPYSVWGLRLWLVLFTFPLSSKPTIPKLNFNSISCVPDQIEI